MSDFPQQINRKYYSVPCSEYFPCNAQTFVFITDTQSIAAQILVDTVFGEYVHIVTEMIDHIIARSHPWRQILSQITKF